MKKSYSNPSFNLIPLTGLGGLGISCDATLDDADFDTLKLITGLDELTNAFSPEDMCGIPIDFMDYCKFTSGINVFGS